MRVFVQPLLAAHFVQCALIAFWYLCTFAAAVTALNVPFPRAFKEAVRLSAARGKTWDSKPSALGWLKDVSVPHVWFWHFYFVGVICNGAALCFTAVPLVARAAKPSLYLSIAAFASDSTKPHNLQQDGLGADFEDSDEEGIELSSVLSLIVMCVLQIHLVRRLAETLCVMRYPQSSRMHILAYIYGVAYYAVLSFTFVSPQCLRTALALVFRSSVNLSSDATSITSSSSISSSVEETLGGVEPSDFETEDQKDIALDLASAVWMVVSVFQCVANTLYSDKLLVLGGVVVMLGQWLQHDSHRRLAALSPPEHIKADYMERFRHMVGMHKFCIVLMHVQVYAGPGSSAPNLMRVASRSTAQHTAQHASHAVHAAAGPSTLSTTHKNRNTLDSLSPVASYLEKPSSFQDKHQENLHFSADKSLNRHTSKDSTLRCRSLENLLVVSRTTSRVPSMPVALEFEYQVPSGGFFELVSCPHYLGEVVIYFGFVIMQKAGGLSPVVLLWVVCFLLQAVNCYAGVHISLH